MKTAGIILLLAVLAGAGSCKKSETIGNGPSYTVDLSTCINPAIKGNRINLCFEEVVGDSRCPANAVCIWQGTAIARFSFTANNQPHSLTLSTVDNVFSLSRDTTVSGYKIEFIDLTPHPGVPSDPSDNKIRAEVKITKM